MSKNSTFWSMFTLEGLREMSKNRSVSTLEGLPEISKNRSMSTLEGLPEMSKNRSVSTLKGLPEMLKNSTFWSMFTPYVYARTVPSGQCLRSRACPRCQRTGQCLRSRACPRCQRTGQCLHSRACPRCQRTVLSGFNKFHCNALKNPQKLVIKLFFLNEQEVGMTDL